MRSQATQHKISVLGLTTNPGNTKCIGRTLVYGFFLEILTTKFQKKRDENKPKTPKRICFHPTSPVQQKAMRPTMRDPYAAR
jgi:hypothetical protein